MAFVKILKTDVGIRVYFFYGDTVLCQYNA